MPRARPGFTLMELLVVIAIIGILATLVTVNVVGYLSRAKIEQAKSQLVQLAQAVQTFRIEQGRYPTNEEGLKILTDSSPLHPDGILSPVPRDPWGRDYGYLCPGKTRSFEIFTLGADGLPGGAGENTDIYHYQIEQWNEGQTNK
jgi:general secretion pathway protein G